MAKNEFLGSLWNRTIWFNSSWKRNNSWHISQSL